jgi:hypothetical protein
VFPWAPFGSTKAAIKLHTLLDLRGNIHTFLHISDGKRHHVNLLDLLVPELGAFYVMDRGYLDFKRLHHLHDAGSFFVTRAKSNLNAQRWYSRSDHLAGRLLPASGLRHAPASYPIQRPRDRHAAGVPDQQLRSARAHHHRAVSVPVAGRVFFGTSANAVKTQIWIAVSVYVLVVCSSNVQTLMI